MIHEKKINAKIDEVDKYIEFDKGIFIYNRSK